jgi:hypothetical protein
MRIPSSNLVVIIFFSDCEVDPHTKEKDDRNDEKEQNKCRDKKDLRNIDHPHRLEFDGKRRHADRIEKTTSGAYRFIVYKLSGNSYPLKGGQFRCFILAGIPVEVNNRFSPYEIEQDAATTHSNPGWFCEVIEQENERGVKHDGVPCGNTSDGIHQESGCKKKGMLFTPFFALRFVCGVLQYSMIRIPHCCCENGEGNKGRKRCVELFHGDLLCSDGRVNKVFCQV